MTHSFPTRRSSDLVDASQQQQRSSWLWCCGAQADEVIDPSASNTSAEYSSTPGQISTTDKAHLEASLSSRPKSTTISVQAKRDSLRDRKSTRLNSSH